MPTALTSEQITTLLSGLNEQLQHNQWQLQADALHREFTFDNFVSAMGFIQQVALYAERINHHPDWQNSYNKVSISLRTHSARALTELDAKLAHQINDIASRLVQR